MPVIAVTGNLCSGKSTVIELLKKKGIKEFCADTLVHAYYRDRKGNVYKKVKKHFPDAFNANGSISRKKLGRIVFSSLRHLRKLENIIHPEVIKDLKSWIAERHTQEGIYLAEVPLLFEKKLNKLFDAVIFVCAPEPVTIGRATRKFGISQKEAKARITNFMSTAIKKKQADFVIYNDSNMRKLKEEVGVIWQELKRMR